MKINKDMIHEIIKKNKKFISAYSVPEAYYVFSLNELTELSSYDEEIINLYYEKLRYAVKYSNKLIQEAFKDDFFNFYGIDRNAVKTPELMFDSFTMDYDDKSVYANLSNNYYMLGHFIQVHWDDNWNIESVLIC